MDSNNISQDVERLVKGFTSLDPVEFDGTINQFFQPHAAIDNSFLQVKGASRVKKFTALQALVADGNEVVGKPSYDDKKKVVNFEFKRTFKYPPILPSLPVASSYFAGQKNWYPCKAQLQLAPAEGESDKGGKLYVSKVAVQEKPQPPLVNFLVYHFLRPFFNIFALVVSQFASFYYRHIKDTWLQFFFAAINEVFQGFWTILLGESSKGKAKANEWKDAKGEDLRKMIEQAKKGAVQAKEQLEAQGKETGAAVDQYKKQAEPAPNEVQKTVPGSTSYFEEQAEHVKKQINNPPKKSDKVETKSAADSKRVPKPDLVSKEQQEAAKNVNVNMDNVPQTPLGGHDPTAVNAPSFAEAAAINAAAGTGTDDSTSKKSSKKKSKKSKSNGNSDAGNDETDNRVNMDDVPTTPLGGHDPTAPNAPSYARAALE